MSAVDLQDHENGDHHGDPNPDCEACVGKFHNAAEMMHP